MNKRIIFDDLLEQDWIQCQIIGGRCVSNQQSKNLIGVGLVGKGSFQNIICSKCAKVLGIKHGDNIPEDAEELLDIYWTSWKNHNE